MRLARVAGPSPHPDASTRLLHWLVEHYRERQVADRAARAIGLGRSQAHARCRRDTGLTILQIATLLRLGHAEHLIAHAGRPRLAAVHEAGFGSQAQYYAARRAYRPPRRAITA
jgi:AraC-like DNA-binding protein